MIRQLQNSEFIREKLGILVESAGRIRNFLRSRLTEPLIEEDTDAGPITESDITDVEGEFRRLLNEIRPENEDVDFLPHDAVAATFQAALDRIYRETNSVVEDTDEENVFGETLQNDPLLDLQPSESLRLASSVYWVCAQGLILRRSHRFIERIGAATPFSIDARMVFFGDWASGIPNALKLSEEIRNHHVQPVLNTDQQLHVVHLGDAYYAGYRYEYRSTSRRTGPCRFSTIRNL